jgi:hypothetical protein
LEYKYLLKKDYHIIRGFAHFSFNNEDDNQDFNQYVKNDVPVIL